MSQASFGIADDSATSSDEVGRSVNGFHFEPRCRVCRNETVRQKVNDLLANGCGYAMIVRALGDENSKLDARDRVTVNSIGNHCARHFRCRAPLVS
jgi:hypothetical protein